MESKENKNHERGGIERVFQIIVGVGMWSWLAYTDHISDELWSEKTTPEWVFIGCKYAFAGMLISGVTPREVIGIIKAWKEK